MIIFIQGSSEAGKSTVARVLADKMEQVAVVDFEALQQFADWMTLAEAKDLTWKNTLAVVSNFVAAGIDVVVPYPVDAENDHDQDFFDFLQDKDTKAYLVHLTPGQPVTDGQGLTLDNSELSAHETAQKILDYIKV
jgi:cytidylate kinase